MLSFALLGQVTIHKDDLPLGQFRSQKELALLVYLAHTGQLHARDAVADLLWEGRTTKQARSNLRTVLTRLRKQVDEDLLITRQTLALTPESLQRVDSLHLMKMLANFGPVDSPQRATALQDTLLAYRGDFLADFYLDDAPLFDDWIQLNREQLRRQVMAAYGRLGQYMLAYGDLDQGMSVARQWLQVGALDENAHMLLIQLLIRAGETGEAVARYHDCVELLRTELDVGPSAELTTLISDILSRQLPAELVPRFIPQLTSGLTSRLGPQISSRHNLPAPHDQFFNRVAAQEEIHSRLDQSWCRLVTIVGHGGVGKTRLALTVARSRLDRYWDGVWLVDLEEVDSDDADLAEAIAVEIASVLDLRLSGTVKPTTQLLNYLAHKEMLLVLDNFDHLLHGVQVVLDIVKGCDRVQMVVTSREALRIRAEWSINLTGLSYAGGLDDQDLPDAVALFMARRSQQRRDPLASADLDAVHTICRMVAGLPLAIELAAALTRTASVPEVAERLQAGFDGLATSLRDMPERHRSLSVVFETSWQTLSLELQQRLARLSTFHGGFTVDAAHFVADATRQDLTELHNKSLLTFNDNQNRYALHPVVHPYAGEKLAAADPAPQKHARYYLSLLATEREALQGDQPQLAVAVLESEIENVRMAWQRGLANREIDGLAAALTSLSIVYQLRGLTREAESVMQATVSAAGAWGDAGIRLASRAGLEQTRFQNRLGRPLAAAQTVESTLKRVGQAGADPWAEAMGHVWWGEALWRLGQFSLARKKLDHALAIGLGMASVSIVGWCHHQFGIIDDIQGNHDRAHEHLAQACAAWRTLGNARVLGASLNSLGLVYYHQGDLSAAQATLEQALVVCTETDNRHLQGMLLNNLSIISTEQGDSVGAQYYLQSGLSLATASGNLTSQGEIYLNLARNYNLLGRPEQAIEQLERGIEIAESTGSGTMMATALFLLADSRKLQGDLALAKSLYDQSISLARQNETNNVLCWALIGMADLLSKQDESQARQYSAEAVAVADVLQNPRLIDRAKAIDSYLNVSVESG